MDLTGKYRVSACSAVCAASMIAMNKKRGWESPIPLSATEGAQIKSMLAMFDLLMPGGSKAKRIRPL
jgi:hypothetical protein